MKKKLLKITGISFLLLTLTSNLTAQTTIINEDFAGTSYTGASSAADLNTAGPNIWISGHNANATKFGIDAPNSNVFSTSNFNWAVHNTPIKGVNGDVITITTEVGFGGVAFINDKAFDLMGLITTNVLADIKSTISTKRDGVTITTVSPNLVVTNSVGAFSANPTIVQGAALTVSYEIIIEYIIGDAAGTTIKNTRIRNTTSGVMSTIGVATGIHTDVYTALTGATGAYFANWSLGFYDATGINRIKINKLKVEKNSTTTLGVNSINKAAITANVSPNPVKNTLNINTNETLQKVEVYNMLGKTVLSSNSDSKSIDVSSLNSGVYLINITTENGVSTKKFIKE